LLPKMPKLIKPLTAQEIKNAKPKDKPYLMFDGAQAGLHVLVSVVGSKSFRLKTKINGKPKTITIGNFSDTSLAEARDKAIELRKQTKAGVDPTHKDVPVKITTFAEVANQFIEWKATVLNRAGTTIRKYRECMKNDLSDAIGSRDIKSIDTAELVRLIEKIDKRSNSLAKKNLELIIMIMRYGIQRGYRDQHTLPDLTGIIQKKAAEEKHIPSNLTEVYKTASSYDEEVMRAAIQLQFLCFTRASETMGALWEEFDLTEKLWHIKPERMKMKRPHVVPLATQTIDILDKLKKITGGTPYLFPSKHTQTSLHRDSLSKAFRSLGITIVPHHTRTAAGTWIKMNGVAKPDLVELQLSHGEENQIKGAYEYKPWLFYMDERRAMMQEWANYLLPPIDAY
jgi:integrase